MNKTLIFRQTIRTGLIAVLILSMMGCGSKNTETTELYKESAAGGINAYSASSSYDYEVPAEEAYAEESEYVENGSAPVDVTEQNTGRKLIRRLDLSVETEDYDNLIVQVNEKINQLGGYTESMNSYNENSIGNRSCYMTIRIPQAKLNDFVTTMEEASNVTHRMENVEDVTLNYVDLESHKKMLLEEQERLMELLGKAETVEDMIAIDARLTDVRYSLESMEQQLRSIDNRVDYSTVSLDITETTHYTPAAKKTPFERIRSGLKENTYGVGVFLIDLFVFLISSLPIFLMLAVFAFVIILIIRRCRRFRKKRKTAKESKSVSVNRETVPETVSQETENADNNK